MWVFIIGSSLMLNLSAALFIMSTVFAEVANTLPLVLDSKVVFDGEG